MGKVQTAHQCPESGILCHMIECLGEDDGVGEGHVPVQHTQGRRVQRARGEETRDQVDIPRGVSIGWHIQGKVGDDLVWGTGQYSRGGRSMRNGSYLGLPAGVFP